MGHYRWFRNQFPPFLPNLHYTLGLGELQACLFPDVVFPPLPLSALSSSPFHSVLKDGFGQTWWAGDMTIPLQWSRGHRVVRLPSGSWHGLPRWWQNLWLYEMRSILRKHLSSMVFILLWSSAVKVHDSQAYKKMDVTRERISRIFELREILQSFQTGFNLVNAAVVCAILESITGLEPSSVVTEPR